EYLTGLGALGDRMLILVNIEKLLSSDEMALLDSTATQAA
ncbi:chemotaxis protein CheW, partial [Pseudocitrobacter faecalis]